MSQHPRATVNEYSLARLYVRDSYQRTPGRLSCYRYPGSLIERQALRFGRHSVHRSDRVLRIRASRCDCDHCLAHFPWASCISYRIDDT